MNIKFSPILRIIFILFLLSEIALSQAKLSIPHIESDIGVVGIPINAEGFDEIGSFTLEITYDTDVLQFIDFSDNHFTTSETFVYNVIDNRIKLIWFDIFPKAVGNVLLEIKFNYLGGSSDINFTGTKEVTTESAELIDAQFVNGSITQIISGLGDSDGLNNKFYLAQNYPNPFNPTTTIEFTIPNKTGVNFNTEKTKLVVFDMLGRKIATLVNQEFQPGTYDVKFDATSLSSGIYLYKIEVGQEYSQLKKMILAK